MSRIEGKVVRIFSDTQLAVNVGSQAGVTKGTHFTIHSQPVEIKDIDGTSLGSISFSKGRVVATHVYERFSIVRTQVASPLSTLALLSAAWEPGKLQKLNVLSSDVDTLEDPDAVKVGDIVVAVEKSEKAAPAKATDTQETEEQEAQS